MTNYLLRIIDSLSAIPDELHKYYEPSQDGYKLRLFNNAETAESRINGYYKKKNPPKIRDHIEDIKACYVAGQTLHSIGQKYGVSREYIRQILKPTGITWMDGGSHVAAIANKAIRDEKRKIREEKRSRAYKIKTGYSYDEFVEINPKNSERTPYFIFSRQKHAASKRGIAWQFRFDEWWSVWQESGKWRMRGKTKGSYVMARFNDVGPYALGNVEIKTCSENCSEAINRSHDKGLIGRTPRSKKYSQHDIGVALDRLNSMRAQYRSWRQVAEEIGANKLTMQSCMARKTVDPIIMKLLEEYDS